MFSIWFGLYSLAGEIKGFDNWRYEGKLLEWEISDIVKKTK